MAGPSWAGSVEAQTSDRAPARATKAARTFIPNEIIGLFGPKLVAALHGVGRVGRLEDYRRAGLLLQDVAANPRAPPYVGALATRLLAQAGEIDAGLALAQTLEHSAPDEETRAAFGKRVKQIQLERVLQEIDRAIGAYKARTGKLPLTVAELLVSGDLPQFPVDPLGGRIYIARDGRARSDAESYRLELNLDVMNNG